MLLTIILLSIREIRYYRKHNTYNLDFQFIAIAIVFSGVIGMCIAMALPEDREYKKVLTQKIVTLRDNKSHVSYFLYSSASTMEYTFYVKHKDYFEMQRLDYSCVKIKYTKSEPRIEEYEKVTTDAPINNWATDGPSYDNYYIIYVPDGTIKTELVLDAQ
jgi:magnesium-transporting ATPase (P-type)